jgi:hypothetical protein
VADRLTASGQRVVPCGRSERCRQSSYLFSVVGEDFFPSAAYALLDAVNGAGPMIISGPGVAPDDGFSGYAPFAKRGAARWGDYSAAVSDEFGNIWMGAEMIPDNPPFILAANWSTFITAVAP